MPTFIYEARKNPKELVKDTLVADNRTTAIQKIGKMGYYPLSIYEEHKISQDTTDIGAYFLGRISLKEVTDFTRQLSDLLESGLTIAKALDILRIQTENRKLKNIILDIEDFCVAGNPLSSALGRHPRVFSKLYVSMVRSGEAGGALEGVLKRLSDLNEKQLEIQTKVTTALAYPILMSVVGSATIVVLLTFVMPKMMVMFNDFGQALPLPTQILLSLSLLIAHDWWLLVVGLLIVIISVMKISSTQKGRLAVDYLILKFPVAGRVVKKIEIARFTRTLGILLNNGVPMLEALKVVSATMNNAVMRQEITKASAAVKEGTSLARGFSNSKVIPLATVHMIAIGEEGGHLETSLLKIAEAGERESDEAIKIAVSLLEPVLILSLGLVVGFIVIAMLLPIFEINFLIR
ncbi:MAG: type II secretion system F family protein [Candidatus Omnitrophica bacterium]|nr:type II secretion system F family protein [Candidatus Omnitrophota bacterium]